MLEHVTSSHDNNYPGVSPQLLARVRQNWSSLCLDLDLIWRDSICNLPGFSQFSDLPTFPDSRPVDQVLLFDQACCWVQSLRSTCQLLQDAPEAGKLHAAQTQSLVTVLSRLREELAAVRMLARAGLAMPAMQIARSISEDVDLALVFLIRRKHAKSFVACKSPEEAADFWRRHVSGGKAFRLVAQALYRFGLDYSNDSEYARWRKEVLVFLGSVVHTSFVNSGIGKSSEARDGLNPAVLECLYFSTIRVQEMCAYALVLGADLQHDIAKLTPQPGLEREQVQFIRTGGGLLVDQMRWLTDMGETTSMQRPAMFH